MRIGIDARLYKETGVGRYIRNLVYWLSRLDQLNYYVIFSQRESVKDIPIPPNGIVEEVNIRWHTFSEQTIFPLILAKHRLDVMHFPYFSIPIVYPGRFIVTIHDLTNLRFSTGKASTLPLFFYKLKHYSYKLVLRMALNRSDKIIVPSFSIASEIKKKFPYLASKIVVTYEGGMEPSLGPSRKLSFEPFILYVGNVYPHKNIEQAILAFSKVNDKLGDNLNLVIVGKEDFFQKRLKKFVGKLRLKSQVKFLGEVSDKELSNLYRRALCLLFPSLSEGFGLPALEAMQHGCLIACSDIPVFREICGSLPFYFDPKNLQNLAETLEKIIYLNRGERMIIQHQEKKQAGRFSWENMAYQTLEVYKEVGR